MSAAGEVSAVSAGNVTVTASFKDLTAECEISVSDPEPAKVGDFFYDDGTWSSDLREDKTCIGVVFYTGNPALHDESLKREHPDCVNGLVIRPSRNFPCSVRENMTVIYGTCRCRMCLIWRE